MHQAVAGGQHLCRVSALLLPRQALGAIPGCQTGQAHRCGGCTTRLREGATVLIMKRCSPVVNMPPCTDKYGSPTLDDMTRFSRALSPLLEKRLGAEVADSIRFDISSPVCGWPGYSALRLTNERFDW